MPASNQAAASAPLAPSPDSSPASVVALYAGAAADDADILRPGGRSGWLEAGWALLDAQGVVMEVNEALCHWLEKPSGEMVGLSLWSLLVARCASWNDGLADLKSSTAVFREVRLRDPQAGGAGGAWYHLERAYHPGGAFVRLSSILPPLEALEESTWDEYLRTESAQREMFIRLLRAESQLKSLTSRWPGVIFSQRADFTFRFVSAKIEELAGVPVSEWEQKPQLFWQVVHEGDAEELRHQFKRAAQVRQPVTLTYRIRHRQTGRVAYVMEHREPIVSTGGLLLGYEGVWLDVTRQTIAERRLSSAAWKETLSVLTMGLAHDFGNVMAGIHALSESFLAQVDERHPFQEGLGLIKKNSLHASQLVHRIINLHQGRVGEFYYHNLNELAADLADLVRKIIPRRIEFSVEYTAEPLPVYIDAVEFRQVVINLVLNAIDAMPRTGSLHLGTAMHAAGTPPPQAHIHGRIPSTPCTSIVVRDTGSGIQPRHLASIFDPFFTTKPMNKGSGLGLYNARLFVEKHRGAISVESVEGKGTCFRLCLPQADFTEAETDRKPDTALFRRSLLVVGRDAGLLEGTAEFLRLNNYHAVAVVTPVAATDCLHSPHYNFSAVLVLADAGDLAVLNWMRELRGDWPQLKLLLKSTRSDPAGLPAGLLEQIDLFIPPDLPQPGILEKISSTLNG